VRQVVQRKSHLIGAGDHIAVQSEQGAEHLVDARKARRGVAAQRPLDHVDRGSRDWSAVPFFRTERGNEHRLDVALGASHDLRMDARRTGDAKSLGITEERAIRQELPKNHTQSENVRAFID
jgi:hypothetical protein